MPPTTPFERFGPTQESRRIVETETVRWILNAIKIGPSCLDMGWEWTVEEVLYGQDGFEGGVLKGWLIGTTFRRPERDSGTIGTGRGRDWWIPVGTTESAIVKTAFVACKMIVEHELLEAFHYLGERIFDPHNTVASLVGLQMDLRAKETDE